MISVILVVVRLIYSEAGNNAPVKVTTWDALGYYMYLPAKFIYQDEQQLKWFPKIDSIYSLSGGSLYQATKHTNGSFVFKYLKGVSLLQLPFFAVAHFYALHSNYQADGFSLPYQYAIAFGCIFYCILALFLLRIILLKYFSDTVTALTLFLLTITSNFVQYVSVDGGQSHAYIFPLYVLMLYATIQWHTKPKIIWTFLIGAIIGLAATCRPTEAVMLFIPLLWNTQTKELWLQKFQFFKNNYVHMIIVIAGMLSGVFHQLLYWKRVTGSWVYDVGSKWDFLTPHFRVLFGWEKGWFIYTPVTVLFVAGLFMMKNIAYRRAVITFCLLNIYIIISWHIWRYGGSYSCRALVQSYPLFAFPLAACTQAALNTKWKWPFLIIVFYFTCVNLFQIGQYNKTIIHYADNNFKYYKAIYLNAHPDALDMSLLDTDEIIRDESNYQSEVLFTDHSTRRIKTGDTIWQSNLPETFVDKHDFWLRFDISIFAEQNIWDTYFRFNAGQEQQLQSKIRLFHPLAKDGQENAYSFFVRVSDAHFYHVPSLVLEGNSGFNGIIKHIKVSAFYK